jgi:hypothetical protein
MANIRAIVNGRREKEPRLLAILNTRRASQVDQRIVRGDTLHAPWIAQQEFNRSQRGKIMSKNKNNDLHVKNLLDCQTLEQSRFHKALKPEPHDPRILYIVYKFRPKYKGAIGRICHTDVGYKMGKCCMMCCTMSVFISSW